MVKPNIPYGRQHISEEDIDAVVEVLRSDFLTQGPKVGEFEQAFAEYVGSKYAVAVSNGTAALHLANLALDVKIGQKVLTTPITFAASANSVIYCGGEVEFIDIDPDTYLIDLDLLEAKLRSVPVGTYSWAIPVDFAGLPVNTERLRILADEFNLWIIEDACHAPGAYFLNSNKEKIYCGSNQFADLTCFSFHPVKHIAAGEGGMITTNDRALYERLLTLRTHGIVKDENKYINDLSIATGLENNKTGEYPGWYMEMQELAFNYRLTDLQAALGLSQLSRAEKGLERRRTIAETYDNAFNTEKCLLGQSGVVEGHAYHLYLIEVEDRLGLYNYLREHKIYTQIHYIPVHLMPYYRDLGHKKGDYPNAEKYYRHCMSLPMYPTLTRKEQEFVIEKIKSYLANA